jgi:hypothetical protein
MRRVAQADLDDDEEGEWAWDEDDEEVEVGGDLVVVAPVLPEPSQTFVAAKEDKGTRLDKFLDMKMPEQSRSQLGDWCDEGWIRVNG